MLLVSVRFETDYRTENIGIAVHKAEEEVAEEGKVARAVE
jgi:hypothetical protein